MVVLPFSISRETAAAPPLPELPESVVNPRNSLYLVLPVSVSSALRADRSAEDARAAWFEGLLNEPLASARGQAAGQAAAQLAR